MQSISLSKATALINRVGTDAAYFDEPEEVAIRPLLDSRFVPDKVEGMKRLMALISLGKDVSDYFPQVVKNVATPSIEVKKLVYMYLIHYAEKRPDEALLSINTLQKDLSDPNPLVRAQALRAMAGMRVVIAAPLAVIATQKCAKDASTFVRRCAASVIPKLHRLDPKQHGPALEVLLSSLLKDRSPAVISSAINTLAAIAPEKLGLIGCHFSRLCQLLPDLDEWGQISALDLLLHFSRTRFPPPKRSNSPEAEICHFRGKQSDLDQILRCSLVLLHSRNSGVVLGAANLLWHLAPLEDLPKVVQPLVFLLRSSPAEVHPVVLSAVVTFARHEGRLFAPVFRDFFVRPGDRESVKALKLEMLTMVACGENVKEILRELQAYTLSDTPRFVAVVIRALSLIAQKYPSITQNCIQALLSFTKPPHSSLIVSESITAICSLVQGAPKEFETTVVKLVQALESLEIPEARAAVVWLLGEYCGQGELLPQVAPLVLRYLAGGFPKEATQTKLAVLGAISKFWLNHPPGNHPPQDTLLLQYIFQLARYDSEIDLRDRARLLRQLLNLTDSTSLTPELLKSIIATPRPPPRVPPLVPDRSAFLVGSISHMVNHKALEYRPLPDLGDPTPGGEDSADSEEGSEYSYESSEGYSGSESGGLSETELEPLKEEIAPVGDVKGPRDSRGTELSELMGRVALESWLGSAEPSKTGGS